MTIYDDLPQIDLSIDPVTKNIIPEVWRDVVGYEGRYHISNYGRILSIERRWTKKGNKLLRKMIDRNGYEKVNLTNGSNKQKQLRIHRGVALAFVPLIDGKHFVNHKDGNKLNNLPYNLEWTTRKENTEHAFTSGILDGKHVFIPIVAVRHETNERIEFKSISDAVRTMTIRYNDKYHMTLVRKALKTGEAYKSYKFYYL